MRSFLVG